MVVAVDAANTGNDLRIALLGGFDLASSGRSVPVSGGSERLLAFVALRCRTAVPRGLVAGTLWPEASDRCAYANLRSALSRLPGAGREALEVGPAELRLAGGVGVDLRDARTLAHRILDRGAPTEELDLGTGAVEDLSVDLLPGWYEDWALLEAEDWRQLRIHALEALARDFATTGRFAEAVAAAGAAVRADPLRGSSQICLVRAYLAEDNPCEALHAFERYERRLSDELGLLPPPRLRQLVTALNPAAGR